MCALLSGSPRRGCQRGNLACFCFFRACDCVGGHGFSATACPLSFPFAAKGLMGCHEWPEEAAPPYGDTPPQPGTPLEPRYGGTPPQPRCSPCSPCHEYHPVGCHRCCHQLIASRLRAACCAKRVEPKCLPADPPTTHYLTTTAATCYIIYIYISSALYGP